MKKQIEKKRLVGSFERSATLDSRSINSDERRVSLLISTQTAVRRKDYWSGEEYDEVLLHGEENVDLSRASTAKLRWMHGSGKYGALPIGKLENVRIENQQLRADAIFSRANPDADMFWAMVEEGTLTEISVGGIKRDFRITERDGDVPLVEVIRWEFQEASLVDIGADPSAGINRKLQGENMSIEMLRRELDVLKRDGASVDDIQRKMDDIATAMEALQEENANLKRVEAINELASKHPVEEELLQRFLADRSKTVDDLARALLDQRVQEDQNPGIGVISVGGIPQAQEMHRAMADALVMRAGVKIDHPHADASMFMGASMHDIIRQVTHYNGLDRNEMINRAMSTGDFPVLLGNVANRVLSTAYSEAEGTFDRWTTATELPDFKSRTEVSRSRLAGRLNKLTEYGEGERKEVSEHAESWRLYSYGDTIKLSREMIINDDLGAFTDLVSDFAAMAKRTANGLVYDLLQSRGEFKHYKMADKKAIFDASHNNYDATGAALETTALALARTKMRRQKDAAQTALNITPSYLLVSPENETIAYQLLNSEADINAKHSGVANPFRRSLDIIVDAELDATPWYLAAKRRTIKVGYLAGTGRKPMVAEKERNLRYVEYECVFDFGLFAEDFRGLYKNAGK